MHLRPIAYTACVMAYYDRDYYRGSGGGRGGDFLGKLLRFLNYSFPIGTYLSTRVYVHITFVLLVAFRLLSSPGDIWWTLRWTSLLFISVLLHEFGHVLACRSVGGDADEILMWPLGGLAFVRPPRRPWPEFVTVIWGPLVNLILAAGAFAALWGVWGGAYTPSLNPLNFYAYSGWLDGVGGLVQDLFTVNYALLLFNLVLVFYPFDGGRIVQIALWTKLGYGRSMLIATTIGMVGAVAAALYGLATQHGILIFIAVFGFITCYQQRRMLREVGPDAAWSHDVDIGHTHTRSGKPGWLGRVRQAWRGRRLRQAQQKEQQLEAEVDRILEKVNRNGLHSLTTAEKRTLQRATRAKQRL